MHQTGHIVVTGGMGYIGSHTTVELLQKGYRVTILDNLSTSSVIALDGIEKITGIRPEFRQVELCDVAALKLEWEHLPQVDAVIHFAAKKAVGESVRNPLLYYSNNLVSLLNVLRMMQEHQVPNIVFSSSCTVYGIPEMLPVTEASSANRAESPYGRTKVICEEMLRDAAAAGSASVLSLRYFNPIGAHSSGFIGELPPEEPENLLPYLTQTADGTRPFLRIFGGDYPTNDGTCVRDYIHVEDLAKAHVAGLHRLQSRDASLGFEAINIGTGRGYSVLEVVAAFEKATGKKVNYQIVDRRPGDVPAIWADTSLASKKLNWKAELGLDEMLASSWKWQQELTKLSVINGR
ncbi:MAG: UDP-glucose 4-epimerase GalE [Flavobacteriales bacterium]|nr:UDP-glucose 4-epimerase GalE [Flavobacteriales bacterium]MCB9447034.1 UDP-glucose 4-epimerase GalE [Flavobacteriales bacterium]